MSVKRCFIAIDLPGEIKKSLVEVQRQFHGWPAKVKWVEEENLHLTLKFLGDINEGQIHEVKKQLYLISSCHKFFENEVKGIGAFPNNHNPKVIWTGLHDPERKIHSLRDDLEEKLEKAGFQKEFKKFSPHLTLGRVKESYDGFIDMTRKIKFAPQILKVEELRLMESTLTPKGPKYTCIHLVGLQEHSSCAENIN